MGGGAAVGAHLPCYLIAVHSRHHHVQNKQVINTEQGILFSVLAVVYRLRLKPLCFQQLFERIGQYFFVLDDQYFHSAPTFDLCSHHYNSFFR